MNISFVMVSVCLVYKEAIANTPLCKALMYCKYSLWIYVRVNIFHFTVKNLFIELKKGALI